MRGAVRVLMVVLAVGGVWGGGVAWGQSAALKPFFGTYVGATLMPSAEMLPRDLRVSIKPAPDGGFIIEWQTTLFKFGEAQRRKSQALEFRPIPDDPSLYQAVTAGGTAGAETPGNPLKDGSFSWAYVQGNKMTIHIVTIIANGGYVLQSYERTLTRGGMALSFARVRNGTVEQRLRAELNRIDG